MTDSPNVLLLNCTLKPSPDDSNTATLLRKIAGLYTDHGANATEIRPVDLNIPAGVTVESVGEGDQFPELYEKCKAADVVVFASPVWLGHRSSVIQRVLERLDGSMSKTDDLGRTPFFNKVAGCVVTGNEDGAHAICESVLFNLTHLGFAIPPMADCYWLGPAGPGKSYAGAGGEKHLYTNKTARFLVASTLALHKALKATPIEVDYNKLSQAASDESESTAQAFFSD
jgi:multimeric flavodoxin WrbA